MGTWEEVKAIRGLLIIPRFESDTETQCTRLLSPVWAEYWLLSLRASARYIGTLMDKFYLYEIFFFNLLIYFPNSSKRLNGINSKRRSISEPRASELSGHSQHHLEDKTEHSAHRSILKVYPRLKMNRTFSNICFFLSFKCSFTSNCILNSMLCRSFALLRWRSDQGKVRTLRLLCENTEENERIASMQERNVGVAQHRCGSPRGTTRQLSAAHGNEVKGQGCYVTMERYFTLHDFLLEAKCRCESSASVSRQPAPTSREFQWALCSRCVCIHI